MTDPLLKVGGITPLTTIDYPDELSAVIYCQGCPWRCHYCHNTSLLKRSNETGYYWPEILEKLKLRAHLLDAVVFSGGEPTLQSSLPNAIDDIKQMSLKAGLHTAGCYPKALQKMLPKLDWVGLDIKALEEDYEQVTGVNNSGSKAWKSLQLLQKSSVDFEVRITIHSQLLPQEKLLVLLQRLADIGISKLALQQCRSENMLEPSIGLSEAGWKYSPCMDFAQQNFDNLQLRIS